MLAYVVTLLRHFVKHPCASDPHHNFLSAMFTSVFKFIIIVTIIQMIVMDLGQTKLTRLRHIIISSYTDDEVSDDL